MRRSDLPTSAPCPARLLDEPGAVLLDAPRPDVDTGRAGARLFARPIRVLTARTLAEVAPALAAVDAALAEGHHVAGFLAYEAGAAFEPGLPQIPTDPRTPLVWFGVYDAPGEIAPGDLDAWLDSRPAPDLTVGDFALSPAAYAARIDAIKAHIRAGDVYQINLTAPIPFESRADAAALFAALRRRQRVSYGALVRLDDVAVVSVSPELFFRVDPRRDGRIITARPMKGTAPRGHSAQEDDRLAAEMQGDEKGRAENLMIVDLLRNDLARVSEPGSVTVPALFASERYETVTQMTSTVQARLHDEVSLGEVFRAIFPCGSVTGAPKIRAMQIIRGLETGPRGVYCGAIGYASPDGSAVFSVAIRTAVLADGAGRYDVGSGVVWDSTAHAERAECLLKATVLTDIAS